ncbi:MAG: molybdopterin cofactor-binding domain-containing protein [Sphingomicrobium sp.]
MTAHHFDRRTLLIGGGAGIGLIVAIAALRGRVSAPLAARQGEQAFGVFLRIGRDGRVTIAVPQAETGQGAWTALPQMLADELGAAWDTVAVEPAPHGSAYANALAGEWTTSLGRLQRMRLPPLRMTAGSTSVRAFEQPLRAAGAVARAMLIAEAAERWDVDASDCAAADGFVSYADKRLGFGALAEGAAGRRAARPVLRRGGLMGQPLPRLDLPAKSDGSFRFAADVRLPGMLFASARMAPPGGRLTGFSRDAAQRAPGFRGIVVRDGWLAVAADSWWAAERAVKAAAPQFKARAGPADLRQAYEDVLEAGRGTSWFSRGDYAAAVAGSRPLAATYWVAPAQHLALEALTATARFAGDRLELWAPSQAPDLAVAAAARAAGIGAGQITFYPMPSGEPGGRSLEADAVPLAIDIARELGRPVQLSLSPSASQNHDRLAPGALARMTALPGAGGITAAWKMRVVTSDGLGAAMARLAGVDPGDELGPTALSGDVPPYAMADVAIEAVPAPFAGGYLRGQPERATVFFIESFIDELARAAGSEPLAFRMALLGGNPRLARCIQAATAAAGWDGGGPGSTLGIAAVSAFGSHIGLVADASIGTDQRIVLHRLVAAVDCGRIVNSQLARQQIAGGLLWAFGLATVRAPEFAARMPRSRGIGALGLPRIAGTPVIEVDLVDSRAAPGGISGLGVAALAPAVANAIYAGTGRRLRSLPFETMAAG